MPPSKSTRFTIRIATELHTGFKAYAQRMNTSMSEVMTEHIESLRHTDSDVHTPDAHPSEPLTTVNSLDLLHHLDGSSRQQSPSKPQLSRVLVQLTVHRKCRGRCPANACESFKGLLVSRPPKMFVPDLGARIEQPNLLSCQWVNARRLVRLCQIARGTCQSAIGQIIASPFGRRDDVFKVEAITCGTLRCMAIFTNTTRPFFHLCSECVAR
jgi:hypothetical protein